MAIWFDVAFTQRIKYTLGSPILVIYDWAVVVGRWIVLVLRKGSERWILRLLPHA